MATVQAIMSQSYWDDLDLPDEVRTRLLTDGKVQLH